MNKYPGHTLSRTTDDNGFVVDPGAMYYVEIHDGREYVWRCGMPEPFGPPKPDATFKPRSADVTSFMSYLLKKLKEMDIARSLDGSQKQNKLYAGHLLTKIGKDYPEHDTMEMAKRFVDVTLTMDYHRLRAISVSHLYYNFGKIVAQAKERKQNPKTQSDDDRKQALAAALAKRFAERRAAGTGEN